MPSTRNKRSKIQNKTSINVLSRRGQTWLNNYSTAGGYYRLLTQIHSSLFLLNRTIILLNYQLIFHEARDPEYIFISLSQWASFGNVYALLETLAKSEYIIHYYNLGLASSVYSLRIMLMPYMYRTTKHLAQNVNTVIIEKPWSKLRLVGQSLPDFGIQAWDYRFLLATVIAPVGLIRIRGKKVFFFLL